MFNGKCQKMELREDWAELEPEIYLLRESENFIFIFYTSNDDSDF